MVLSVPMENIKIYEAPATNVVGLKAERIVCTSPRAQMNVVYSGIENSLDTARNLKDLKVPIDTIIQATGLDAKVIKAL